MATNLAALYEDPHDAEAARGELLAAGFDEQAVRVTSRRADGALAHPADELRLARFFDVFFTPKHRGYAELFREGIRRGLVVVTVHGTAGEACERACAILERHGPLDVDALAAQWSATDVACRSAQPDAAPRPLQPH